MIFLIKVTGKTNLYFETQRNLPIVDKYREARTIRMLLLSCVNNQFDALWEKSVE